MFAQSSATFVCEYLGKDLMVARTMLAQEQENGFLVVVVQHTYHLGESPGFRYDYLFEKIHIKSELNTQNNLYF